MFYDLIAESDKDAAIEWSCASFILIASFVPFTNDKYYLFKFNNMVCTYHFFDLAFKYPFTIARGTKTHQPTLIVELNFHGIKGYGEAPAIDYYHITVEKMIEDLETKKIH